MSCNKKKDNSKNKNEKIAKRQENVGVVLLAITFAYPIIAEIFKKAGCYAIYSFLSKYQGFYATAFTLFATIMLTSRKNATKDETEDCNND